MDTAALRQKIGEAKNIRDAITEEYPLAWGYWRGYTDALLAVLEAESREWKRITPQFDPLPGVQEK